MHNWFLMKLKKYIEETRFYHHTFIFFMCDDLSFINTMQTENFSWRVLAETWDASCFKKGPLEKKFCLPPSNYSEIFNPPLPQAGRRGVHALELHLKYGRGSESTSGYKNKCKWRSSNYLLILIKLLHDSRQIYPEEQFLHLHQTLGLQSLLSNMSRSIKSRSSLLSS